MSPMDSIPEELLSRILEYTLQTPEIEVSPNGSPDSAHISPTQATAQRILHNSFASLGLVSRKFHRLLLATLPTHPKLHSLAVVLQKHDKSPTTAKLNVSHTDSTWFAANVTHLDITIDMNTSAFEIYRIADTGFVRATWVGPCGLGLGKRIKMLFPFVEKLARYPKLGSIRLHVKTWAHESAEGDVNAVLEALVEKRLRGLRLKREKKVVVEWSVGRRREEVMETQQLLVGAMP